MSVDSDLQLKNYILQSATEEDSQFFYELKKLVLRHYIEAIWGWDEEFQLAFHRDNYRPEDTFIIRVEDQAAGTVEVREDKEKIFICSLYIHPDYQGKSIGSSIVKDYLASADLQRKRTDLEVLRLNTRALELYKRLGFVEIIEKGDDVKHYLSRPFNNK